MAYEAFDPIAVEAEMIKTEYLPTRVDTHPSRMGQLEHYSTEQDRRLYALWRISMVRQFQPAVLKQLSAEDLLYLAGQSPEGDVGQEFYGIQLDRKQGGSERGPGTR
jgi:hypothetical protein